MYRRVDLCRWNKLGVQNFVRETEYIIHITKSADGEIAFHLFQYIPEVISLRRTPELHRASTKKVTISKH